ncbi:uncharacterized protein DUF4091 [Anseongella ginsenosidimutans]|uniref:Uncharacterized protein DUF4091 n=1 Tax=Anseongella ginsenosidimutans TaxID=496056 RepID=A0A4R3KUM1_9SPHI|nr:DUF4091 domain-containing protein [Anseongella ginsenosidimutans]QEC51506.1 DUF4091 domain-containing protein [Anseongella ginsenosidimutans]TCS88818.1 uncharacterized protein DUF4091 [Anseongella ginsenosidimutans]
MIKFALPFFSLAALLASCTTSNQTASSGSNVIFADYQELPDPDPADEAAWSELDKPLYARFGSTNHRYAKSQVPPVDTDVLDAGTKDGRLDWQGKAWKGEKVNLQVVLWATEDIPAVKVNVSELATSQGEKIPATAVEAGFVRYVMTDEFAGGCGHRKPADFDSSLVADVIDVIPAMDIPARSVRPVWIQIEVPRDAAAGDYTGTLTIENSGKAEVKPLTVKLEVQDHVLPPPSEWTFHLDLWQNPFSVSRVNQVDNWSPAHFEAMTPSMELLADAGQKIITASIIHDPWNSQTYDIYESMVRWVKKKDGSWEYDYSVFDKWVEYMSDLGIGRQINCYSMVPWNLKFYYYDENLGRDTLIVAEPGTTEYNAHWRPMLESFASHLKEKGWFERTTIAMDERPLEAMQAVIELVKSVDKDFKIALAGNYHSEIAPDIYDYCLASAQHMSADTMQLRREEGKITTYYTCCVEAYPNTFTFSPPAESTWLAWHSAAKGYDGYLRWAYNCWVEDPLRDTRFRSWPAGDTYLVYPGARSSIRFEKMIDGIEDYVKIHVLKAELEENGDTEGLKKLQAMLEPFKNIPQLATVPAGKMLEEARSTLDMF